MSELKILDHNGPARSDLVLELEEKVAAKLPEDYLQFLEVYNGGRPEPDTFSFDNEDDATDVHCFFGVGVKGADGFDWILEVFTGRIPDGYIPIAGDSGGNLVCMDLRHDGAGRIYFWDHEFEADEEAPSMDNMYLVANSFTAFLAALYEYVDDGE